MNRRVFLSALAQAAAAFTILPSAVTYERTWKRDHEEALWTYEIQKLDTDQRLFVTTFFFGCPIPESVPCWTYDDFTKLRRKT